MNGLLRVAIVDDEPLARQSVELLLRGDRDVELAGEAFGAGARELIERTHPDILFLDIQMPEVDGFELLNLIDSEMMPVVVFITAYDRFAVRAFEVHALDYLLKPFDDARFARTLARAKEQALIRRQSGPDGRVAQLVASRTSFARRILVRTRERSLVVNVSDIDWIEAADYYVTIHAGGKNHLLRQTMAAFESQLDPEHFVRVHRSAIVNIDRVREMHPLFRGHAALILADGTRVRLSRNRREQFERLFKSARRG